MPVLCTGRGQVAAAPLMPPRRPGGGPRTPHAQIG
jgi:hypothetical protein